MEEKKHKPSWSNWLLGVVAPLLISGASAFFAWVQTKQAKDQAQQADSQARESLYSSNAIAQKQNDLAERFHTVEQWQKFPKLNFVRCYEFGEVVSAVIQNEGGRDLVLHALRVLPLTPSNEEKKGSIGDANKQFDQLNNADRSKILPLNLFEKDVYSVGEFIIDPPAVVEAGKSLVIKVKRPRFLPTSIVVEIVSNSVTHDRSPAIDRIGYFYAQQINVPPITNSQTLP